MIESILVEDESSMLFSTGKLPEKQVFLCNRKFLGIPYYIKRHCVPESAVRGEEYIAVLSAHARKCATSAYFVLRMKKD